MLASGEMSYCLKGVTLTEECILCRATMETDLKASIAKKMTCHVATVYKHASSDCQNDCNLTTDWYIQDVVCPSQSQAWQSAGQTQPDRPTAFTCLCICRRITCTVLEPWAPASAVHVYQSCWLPIRAWRSLWNDLARASIQRAQWQRSPHQEQAYNPVKVGLLVHRLSKC